MPCNEFFYLQVRTGSGTKLRFRIPEEESIHEVFARETIAVSEARINLELLEDLALTKLRTNIGAP